MAVRLRDHGPFQLRRRGTQFRRAHVGPDDAASFDARVSLDGDPLFEAALGRLGWHVHAAAVDVVLPAMVDTSQAALLVAPEEERGATVRTVLVQERDSSGAIPKGYQPLAHQLQPERWT